MLRLSLYSFSAKLNHPWTLLPLRPLFLTTGLENCKIERPGLFTGHQIHFTFTGFHPTISYTMAFCSLCDVNIDHDQQSYQIMNMGEELMNLLPERVLLEITEHAELCSECFERISRTLCESETEPAAFSVHDINSCFCCHASLQQRRGRQRRSLVLQSGPVYNHIAATTNLQIPTNVRICYACWFRVHRYIQRNSALDTTNAIVSAGFESQAPVPVVSDHCILCSHSIFGLRTYLVPEGPERIIIASRIHPRQVPENARACHGCWLELQRSVERQLIEQAIVDQEDVVPENPTLSRRTQETIHLDTVKRVNDTTGCCFVPGCQNSERFRVPMYLKKKVLSDQSVYIPKNCRVCGPHKIVYNWEFLQEHEFRNDFTKSDIEDMLKISKKGSYIPLDFTNIEGMDVDCCKFWLGVNIEQFLRILNESNILCRNPKVALGLYLLKLRTGEPIRRIASLMRMAPSQICKLIAKARIATSGNFVPRHLGTNHLSRQELVQKNLIIPKGLFANENNINAITICDGTYIYVQKSSNYLFQKMTYSLHKYRNLVKPLLIVATDGYIIDVFGPYGATVSDADIMKKLFQNEDHPLRSYFQRGDVFILDRGFRDSLPLLNSLGYKIYKPESLTRGETQLSTLAANKSRCVTLCRWVVEVVNGRFKRDFKIFRSEYFNLASKNLMTDFRFAAALLNTFHPVIQDRPDAALILNKAQERLLTDNYLADYVIENNLNRHRASFRSITTINDELDMFPRMTMSDLIMFSLGIYQIKQARSYYGEHIRQHGTFVIEVADLEQMVLSNTVDNTITTQGLLIRGRIRSRHQASKMYYTYLLLVEGENWEESIKHYYCSCICGKRTVGCCAHTMTLVWYLGWARHENNIEVPASFLDGILVREDSEDI